MAVLNYAADLQVKEKEAYLKLVEKDRQEQASRESSVTEESEKREESGKKQEETSGEGENDCAEQMIRVLLMTTGYQSYFHPSVTAVRDGETISCTVENMQSSGDTVTIPPHKNGIQITSIQRQCGSPVYQGNIEIRKTPQGLEVINQVPLETYLEAVVPSEMPSSYEKEALKAQAVCARTYAWKQMQEGRLKEYGADVDDSVSFQVYQNVSPHKSTTEAVRETKGQILCYDGRPIQAYYFSTSAGATSTDEIWGAETAAPYLKSVTCKFDSQEAWSKWETRIPWETLEIRAGEHSGKAGVLYSVSATEKNESGAVTGLKVVTENGSFTLEEEYSIRQFLSPQGYMVTERDGTVTEGGSLLPSAYFSLESDPGASLLIRGGGFGHGVGMSQNGANAMAGEGYTFREILDYFFKDVELEKLSQGYGSSRLQ